MKKSFITPETRGGISGHILRRSIHLFMVFIPFLYYYLGPAFTRWTSIPVDYVVLFIVAVIILFEIIRFIFQWTTLGQRPYEKGQMSAFTWAAVGVVIVLWALPKEYGIPIIVSWALGDPLLGELRSTAWSRTLIFAIGVFVITGIWLTSGWLFQTPYEIAAIMGVITVAAEWPNLKWLDDNITMLLVPTLVVFFINTPT